MVFRNNWLLELLLMDFYDSVLSNLSIFIPVEITMGGGNALNGPQLPLKPLLMVFYDSTLSCLPVLIQLK